MEIEFKDKKNYVRFGDIKKGDIFLFNGKIFMKCQKIGNYTAIDLADGSRIYGKFSKEVNKLQYYNPEFSVQMKSETDPSTGVFVLLVSNTGNATMRIYSKGALLRDNDYVKYNRELYLSKTTVW